MNNQWVYYVHNFQSNVFNNTKFMSLQFISQSYNICDFVWTLMMSWILSMSLLVITNISLCVSFFLTNKYSSIWFSGIYHVLYT